MKYKCNKTFNVRELYKGKIVDAGMERDLNKKGIKIKRKPGVEYICSGFFKHKGKMIEFIVGEHWLDYDDIKDKVKFIKDREKEMIDSAKRKIADYKSKNL